MMVEQRQVAGTAESLHLDPQVGDREAHRGCHSSFETTEYAP